MTNLEIIASSSISVALGLSLCYNYIQHLQKRDLANELIASDDQSKKVEQLHDALSKSNYLMSLSGNLAMQGQVHENRKILSN